MSAALASGFDDPVFEAQAAFRAALGALARPGIGQDLPASLRPPAPLSAELAALALTLADPDAPLWLDGPLAASSEVATYLRFHTGARIVTDPLEAAFALVSDPANLPSFSDFAQGSDEYPDRSTTLLVSVANDAEGPSTALEGPGIRGRIVVSLASLPEDFENRLRANRALFPRGVDCLLVSAGRVTGLPRSVSVVEAA